MLRWKWLVRWRARAALWPCDCLVEVQRNCFHICVHVRPSLYGERATPIFWEKRVRKGEDIEGRLKLAIREAKEVRDWLNEEGRRRREGLSDAMDRALAAEADQAVRRYT